jgi:hypothetical protein
MIKDGVNGLVPDEQNAKIVEASVTVQFEEDGSTSGRCAGCKERQQLDEDGFVSPHKQSGDAGSLLGARSPHRPPPCGGSGIG